VPHELLRFCLVYSVGLIVNPAVLPPLRRAVNIRHHAENRSR
jgi:hypothetical protein